MNTNEKPCKVNAWHHYSRAIIQPRKLSDYEHYKSFTLSLKWSAQSSDRKVRKVIIHYNYIIVLSHMFR